MRKPKPNALLAVMLAAAGGMFLSCLARVIGSDTGSLVIMLAAFVYTFLRGSLGQR